jgi:hypothetical protein
MSNQATGCDNQFGGRVSFNIGGVQFTPSDADITIKPTGVEVDAQSNRDGSMATMVKIVPYEADVKFRNGSGIVWQNQMMLCSVDCTIQELDNNRLHIFTSARLTGRPDINLSTGEVTGVVIKSAQYQPV